MNRCLRVFALGVVVAVVPAACGGGGGGGGGTPVPIPTSSPSGGGGTFAVAPDALSIDAVGTSQKLTVSEQNYSGVFTLDDSACTKYANVSGVTAGPSSTLTVTGLAAGTCSLSISDAAGNKKSVSVTVTSTSGVIQ